MKSNWKRKILKTNLSLLQKIHSDDDEPKQTEINQKEMENLLYLSQNSIKMNSK